MLILRKILDLIFPYYCPICGKRAELDERPICLLCNIHMPRTEFAKRPHDNRMALEYTMMPNVEKVAALYFHQSGSDFANVIYDMKYHGKSWLCENMGRLMAEELKSDGMFEGVDALIPIPLSAGRIMHRGYNQSECLAKGISKVTGIPVIRHAVLRKKFMGTQTHLSRSERQSNVENVFVLADADVIANKHVLLIDDVITTCATTKSCIRQLLLAENVKVSILSLAYAGRG